MEKGMLNVGDLVYCEGRVFKVVPNVGVWLGTIYWENCCLACVCRDSSSPRHRLCGGESYQMCFDFLGSPEFGLIYEEITGDENEIQRAQGRKVEVYPNGEIRDMVEGGACG